MHSHIQGHFQFFVCFGYWPLIIFNCLLPFSSWPFCFVDSFFHCAKAFQSNVVSFVEFYFCPPCLRRHIQKKLLGKKKKTAFQALGQLQLCVWQDQRCNRTDSEVQSERRILDLIAGAWREDKLTYENVARPLNELPEQDKSGNTESVK